MLHQSVALSSKAMLRDAVPARTLRLNDRCIPGEMAFTGESPERVSATRPAGGLTAKRRELIFKRRWPPCSMPMSEREMRCPSSHCAMA